MNHSVSQRVPRGTPAGGQFAPTAHPEADLALDPPQAAVEVYDASGDPVEVTPGVLDENARWVYAHGQCLALAVAASERTGWPVYLRTYLDGDPADPAGTYPNLRHALLLTPDGTVVDVTGEHDPESWETYPEDLPDRIVPSTQAPGLLAEYGGYLEHQDLDVARTFVDPTLTQAGFEIEDDEGAQEEIAVVATPSCLSDHAFDLVVDGRPVTTVEYRLYDAGGEHGIVVDDITTSPADRGRGYALTALKHLHTLTDGDLFATETTPEGEALRLRYEAATGKRYINWGA